MTLILPDDLTAFESKLTRDPAQPDQRGARWPARAPRDDSITGEDRRAICDRALAVRPVDSSCRASAIETKAPLARSSEALGMPLAFDAGARRLHRHPRARDATRSSSTSRGHPPGEHRRGREGDRGSRGHGRDHGGHRRRLRSAVPRKTITLRLDHPFLFVLRDVETGAVLFMGRVVDPSVGR